MKKKQIASIDYDGSNIKLRVTDRITAIELIGADQNAEDEELAMTLAGYVLADRIKCFSDENGCDIGNVAKQVTGGLLLTLADLLTVTNAPEDKVEFIECLANRARDSIVCLYGGDGELSLNVDGECLVSYAGDHVMKSADVVEAAVIEILARGIAMVTDVGFFTNTCGIASKSYPAFLVGMPRATRAATAVTNQTAQSSYKACVDRLAFPASAQECERHCCYVPTQLRRVGFEIGVSGFARDRS